MVFTGLLGYPERGQWSLICCESELCTDKHSLVQLYPVLNDLMQSMNKVRSILHTDGSLTCKDDFHILHILHISCEHVLSVAFHS